MKPFTPEDHYWTVAGDEDRVWSSAVPGYVSAGDTDYAAWREAGGWPTRIASEAELDDVLRAAGHVDRSPLRVPADVIAERERRLALGFDYDFQDERGVHRIGTTAQDMVGWRDVTDLANALIAAADTTTTIQIVTDTGPAEVTAAEWTDVLLASATWRQPIWAASFILQASDPIPDDFTDDAYWMS